MTKAEQFKLDHPSLSNCNDIEGMITLMLTNNGVQWSDEGSFAIRFDDNSTYHTYIITTYFIDKVDNQK
jgi:hypothetical protein